MKTKSDEMTTKVENYSTNNSREKLKSVFAKLLRKLNNP